MAGKGTPFRHYIAALLLAIAVPLAGGLGWLTYRDFEKSEIAAKSEVLQAARASAAQTGRFLGDGEVILRNLSQHHDLRALDSRKCGSLLAVANEILEYYANVITRNAAGDLICTGVRPISGGAPSAPDTYYLRETLRTGKFTVGKPVLSSITGKWTVALAYPLRAVRDATIGVIAMGLDLEKFHKIAGAAALGARTTTQIITGDGVVIASSQDGATGIGRNARQMEFVSKAPNAAEGTVHASDAAGTARIYGFAAVPGTDWRIYASTPTDDVFAGSRRSLAQNVAIIVAVIGVAALLAVLVARAVITPIGDIAIAAAAVAAGNVTARADVNGPVEIRTVAKQFNEMLDVLHQTEQRLSGIIESAMDPIVVIDERHKITLVNPAVEKMFGYREADLIGCPVSILIPERYLRAHEEHINNFGRTTVTSRPMGAFGQVMGRRAGGGEFPIDASISQTEKGGQRLFTVILRDVTRRIEAEKALRESHDLLDRIFATTHFCIVYLDRSLDFVRVNKAYAAACGRSPEDFTGRNYFELYPEGRVEAIFREAVATGKAYTFYTYLFEFFNQPDKGPTYWDWTLHPIMGANGHVEGLLFALLDVTDRNRAERELLHKTALAQLLETLARASSDAATPGDALKFCLESICNFGNWTLGRIATTRELSRDLGYRNDSVWHAAEPARYGEFIRVSPDLDSSSRAGRFISAVQREKKPVWISDLTEPPGILRSAAAGAAGLRAAFAFPVVVDNQTVAVLEFFADVPRPADATLINASKTMAAQLATLIERSRAEKVNAQLAAIIEYSNDAILSCSLDHTILTWNAAADRLFGYSAAEAIGRNVSMLVPSDQEAQAEQQRALGIDGRLTWTFDSIRVTRDGQRVDVSISHSPILDARGLSVGLSIVYRDISLRKRAEIEHAQLAAIVDSAGDAIIGRTLDGTITSWNPAAERMFGYTASEAIGQSSSMLTPEPYRRQAENGERLRRGESIPASERRRLTRDGRLFSVISSISPVRNEAGEVVSAAIITHDISELKKAEDELKRKAALSELMESLARAANEAATPDDALRNCLAQICNYGGWTIGHVGTFVPSQPKTIARTSIWHCPEDPGLDEFIKLTDSFDHSPQAGQFVSVAIYDRKPVWISDLTASAGFGRRKVAVATGFRSGFVFPVVVGEEVLAFLEFFDGQVREPDALFIDAIGSVGSQLARVIERQSALDELRDSEARFRAIFDYAGVGITMRPANDRHHPWIHVNDQFCALLGYTREELLRMSTADITPPDELASAVRDNQRLIAGEIREYAREKRVLRKDGTTIWVNLVVAILPATNRSPQNLIAIYQDISVRKRAEVERSQLAAIVTSSNDAIFSRGPDGTILTWNSAAKRMFGWSAHEAIGQPLNMLLPPERLRPEGIHVDRVPRAEPAAPVLTTHVRKDGQRIQTQVTFSPVIDQQGNIIAVSNTVRDMSELMRKELELRTYATRLRTLSQRLREVEETERHAISRELHDRIGQDLSTLSLLFAGLTGHLSPKSRDSVHAQMEDIQGLLKSTVTNVRDVMAELRPPVLDDYGLFAALRHLVSDFSRRSGIAVSLSGSDLKPRLPPIVETAIFRICQEALNNVAKHARAGKVDVSVNATPERVAIEIADDGIGFVAGNTPQNGKHWGLITMRERAEGLDIGFHLESEPGAGTRVALDVERSSI